MATQADRRTATRVALLDASAACLVERGLSGFTTSEVIERSGRSTGALYSHFETKSDLLEATVANVLEQLRASFLSALEAMPDEDRTVEGLLRLLWQETSDPRLGAVWEIYAAGRTDPSIRAAIEPAVRGHVIAIRRLMRDEVGDRFGVPNERVLKLANLVILAMQGLAVNQLAAPAPDFVDAMVADMADLVDWAFADDPGSASRQSVARTVARRPHLQESHV